MTPMPWRYYTKGKDFSDHLQAYKSKYPAVPMDKVVYRLFQTTQLGKPYELE